MSQRKRTRGLPIDGVLLLDKPAGMTSNQALQKCRFLLNARKGGHTGALDPLATGLLPLCFGQATKISSFLLGSDKTYRVGARLGQVTDTGDADGQVLDDQPVKVELEQLQQVLSRFVGEYDQVPPMYSALKVNGQPLYKLARQGIDVERKARRVSAYDIRLISYDAPDLYFEVDCSSGFYVRSLVEDIGTALGCGAHVIALRRTRINQHSVDRTITLESFANTENQDDRVEYLLSPDSLLVDLPSVELDSHQSAELRHGQAVTITKPIEPEQWVRIYGPNHNFLGLGQIKSPGLLAPRRLFV